MRQSHSIKMFVLCFLPGIIWASEQPTHLLGNKANLIVNQPIFVDDKDEDIFQSPRINE